MQDQTVEMYGANKQTKLGKSMFGLAGQQMICTATYLACLVKGKSQAEAFGISWAVGAALAAKFCITEADDLKVPKADPRFASAKPCVYSSRRYVVRFTSGWTCGRDRLVGGGNCQVASGLASDLASGRTAHSLRQEYATAAETTAQPRTPDFGQLRPSASVNAHLSARPPPRIHA